MVNEQDILELGIRTAFWLAAASDDPKFMLASHKLHERGPQPRMVEGSGFNPSRKHGVAQPPRPSR